MTGSMLPEEQQLLIAGYVLGQLDAEEAAAFAQQLHDNPALWQEVDQLQRTLEAGLGLADVPPPPHLRSAILQQVPPPPEAAISPSDARPQITTLPRWVKGLGAIAAVAIAGLSFSNFLLWRSLQEVRLAAVGQPTLQVDLAPAADLPGRATVLVDPNRLQAELIVEGLSPLPPGQVYVLWTVLEADAAYTTDAKNAILTQVFRVDDQGQLSEQIVVPQAFRDRDLIEAMAITIEDASAPQRHESAPILFERL